jgi:hypothetical protein
LAHSLRPSARRCRGGRGTEQYKDAIEGERRTKRLKARNSAVGKVKDKLRRFGNLFGMHR